MSNKTRSILKAIAVIVVLLCVLMHIDLVSIAYVEQYKFWLMVISFGLLLIASK
jgi:hypothetical protein